MNEKDKQALFRLGSNYTPPQDPKVITARQLRRKLRLLTTTIRQQDQHCIKVSEVGTDWEIHQAQLQCAKLQGMKDAYESLLQGMEAC